MYVDLRNCGESRNTLCGIWIDTGETSFVTVACGEGLAAFGTALVYRVSLSFEANSERPGL